MAVAALALYSSWRKSIPSRLFVTSVDAQTVSARNPNRRRNRQKLVKNTQEVGEESNLQPQRGRRPSRKKWSEKRMDSEFDMVIVPPDGISVSGSDTDDSDWSIGWFEPHSKKFTDDEEDSFAVLMPCYGSPTPPDTNSRKAFTPNEQSKPPVWSTMFSRQSSIDHKKRLERWLSGIWNWITT